MKNLLIASAMLAAAGNAFAEETAANIEGERANLGFVISACLNQFGEHPFDAETVVPKYLAPSITVFGNGVALEDAEETAEPKLTIIAPAVNVLGEATYKLLNPNGWYCLSTNVSVLGKTNIELACDAHFVQANIAVGAEVSITRPEDCGNGN